MRGVDVYVLISDFLDVIYTSVKTSRALIIPKLFHKEVRGILFSFYTNYC